MRQYVFWARALLAGSLSAAPAFPSPQDEDKPDLLWLVPVADEHTRVLVFAPCRQAINTSLPALALEEHFDLICWPQGMDTAAKDSRTLSVVFDASAPALTEPLALVFRGYQYQLGPAGTLVRRAYEEPGPSAYWFLYRFDNEDTARRLEEHLAKAARPRWTNWHVSTSRAVSDLLIRIGLLSQSQCGHLHGPDHLLDALCQEAALRKVTAVVGPAYLSLTWEHKALADRRIAERCGCWLGAALLLWSLPGALEHPIDHGLVNPELPVSAVCAAPFAQTLRRRARSDITTLSPGARLKD